MSERFTNGKDTAERAGPRYEDLLRAIGAGLDQDAVDRIAVMEVDDGFLVRSERFRYTYVDASVSHVTYGVLSEGLKRVPGRARARVARRRSLWSDFSVTWEDFLRALGFELDHAGARSLLLDELEAGLWLSYAGGDAEGETGWIRQVVVGKADIEEILNEATRRRRAPSEGGFSQQLGVHPAPTRQSPVPSGTNWTPMRDDVPYQPTLRSIGAMLDVLDAERVSVLEAPGRFAVRYDVPGGGRLRWQWAAVEELKAGRSPLKKKRSRPRPSESQPPGGYEDLFRALGYQLEGERASGLLIDLETPDLIVSYSFLDPRQSFTRTGQSLTLRRSEQIALCDAASRRRAHRRDFLSRLGGRG